MVPVNSPRGVPPPASTAFAFPFRPAAIAYFNEYLPATTAVTSHLKVFVSPGFSGPSADVPTYAVSPPEGPLFTTNCGRRGSASVGSFLFWSNDFTVTATFGIVFESTFFTVIVIVDRLRPAWPSGTL